MHETAEGHGHDDGHHDADHHATGGHEAAVDNHHNTDSTPAAAAPVDSTAKSDSAAEKTPVENHEGHGH
jgi:hypothetical protein